MNTAGLSVPFLKPIEFVSPLQIAKQAFQNDLAMDLGTANTLIYARHKGIVVNEPSIVAVDEETGKAVAVGHAAKEMFGKTNRGIRCVRPMKDGVIADFEMTSLMINYMLSKSGRKYAFHKPRLVIGVPSGITQVEKRAVIDAAARSGARQVMLMEEPMAAAIGAGLPVDKAIGNMVVDIGGGTTEVAIISMGGTLYSHSIRVAGDEMDEAVQRLVRKHFGLDIGIFEAERIKLLVGSALPAGKPRSTTVYGRDISTGFPHQVELNDDLVRDALQEPLAAIIASVVTALEQTTPEIAHDIMARGIYLAGGGALLKGLAERLHRETGVSFHRAGDPLTCVVRGVGAVVENLKTMKSLCIN